MSRITDYILEPKVVYTEGGFLVRVKVIDDYKYKKYIVSENLHYKTVQGTSFTLTDADTTKQAEITEIRGKGEKRKLPSEYQEVEYIESTETQYIDTGVSPTSNTGFTIEYQESSTSGTKTLIGSGTSAVVGYIGISRNGTQIQAYWGKPNNVTSYTFTFDVKHELKFNLNSDRKVVMDGTEIYTLATTPATTITTNTLTLFAFKFSSIVQYSNALKLYSCQIYDNETLVRNYIPCYRKSDNVIGMYDTVNNEFYTNDGTGTFGKGADVVYENVTGDNNIVVSNKNLINIADRSGTMSNFYYYDILTNYLLEAGETYTVSYDAIVSLEPFNVSVGAGTTGYQRDIKTVTGNVSGRISVTFTPNEYQLALGNKFYIRVPRYNTPQTTNYEIKNIQLEKGTRATDYTEHEESSKNITLARIPSEYQEVEYIQSNGSQYINTGYPLWNTTNWKIQADFSIDEHYNYNAILGYDDITDTSNEVWIYSNTNYAWRACGRTNLSLMQIPLNTRIEIIHDNSTNNFITTIDGVVKWNTTKLTNTSNHNLCFGHRAGGGWLKGKIYGLKLWSEGTLVRDFIPCYRISDNIAGLYDTVNNVFYPNANTGSTAQPFISGEENRTTIQLSGNDKLWNNNGTWQLNDNAITDNYLLEQLQALENIELYENLCYVDWVGIEKPTMTLQYAGTEDLGIKYIITEDGKKIRTDWRKLGRRKNG